ncbi:MAG: zinc-dependent metalloprotease, partial [Microthrixaceae bacterium]
MGPFMGELRKLMGASNQWESAAQIAAGIANEGHSESNLDPADRIAVEELARVAELRVADHTGLALSEPLKIEPMNRSQWAKRLLDDERELFGGLADSLRKGLTAQMGELDDLGSMEEEMPSLPGVGALPPQMLEQILAMMGPMMLSMMAGSTAGHLAARALGHYELPIPRPGGKSLTMVLSNVDDFAQQWSLPTDDIRLWVCLSDVAHHQVLCIPHVRERIEGLIGEYTRSFTDDPELIERQARDLGLDEAFDEAGADMAALQSLAADPDRLLGAMQSDRQRALMPEAEALVATVEGWVDHVLDQIGTSLLSDYGRVTEALRRRRFEAGPQTRFIERLLGLELSQSTFDRGASFINGIVERADESALGSLWDDPEHLPTASEMDAPGLWMARIGIEAREVPFDGDFEIPDAPDF